MKRAHPVPALILAALMALAAAPVAAQSDGAQADAAQPDAAQAEGDPWAEGFRPLPLHQLAERVSGRYAGRLVAAETRPPTPPERDLGAELVYEFRLVTPDRNILNIRLDARTGRFLDVAGQGQLQARRPRN
ncbi:PepSY domain-containing protein [Paracoccus aestuarii]|uniref:PepSY domain-containing protein n=1 Tax=Paracoccus aestuarii TaxID=453842 RepID=UPI00234FD4F5|nr:PepSY domain-containing protein [Paracoccus aestuarii]WCQ98222.1 PepSY domain-containing protein [Paracoccus aestuarii]